MSRWILMTSGLLIWGAHFLGVYTISSLGDVVATADAPLWRMAALGFSLACMAAEAGFLLILARRRRRVTGELEPFVTAVGVTGGLVGLVGVAWQALPTLLGY
jgi:hypothetical protein